MDGLELLSREELIALARQLYEQVQALTARVTQLEAELAARKMDPPSGVARAVPTFVKPNAVPKEKKARKKRSHSYVRHREEPTRTVEHAVERCPECGRRLSGGWVHRRRQVIEIPEVAYDVIEHQILGRHCGVCAKNHVARPDLSGEVVGQGRFGIRLMSLLVMLKKSCRMTVSGIRTLLRSMFGLAISRGEVVEVLHRVAKRGQSFYEELKGAVQASPHVNVDETSWRQSGKNEWLWTFCTPDVRLFVQDPSRGHQVPKRVLGESFSGILASDFLSAYSYYTGPHQRCWVHFLRDLKALEEAQPDSTPVREFVAAVKRVYQEAKTFRSEDPRKRYRARDQFQRQLVAIAVPWLGRENLLRIPAERIHDFAHQLFTFVAHPEVTPDNNVAERAIRPPVIYRKVTGGSRSPAGAQTTSVLLSLVGTWTLRGHDVFAACQQMLAATMPATTLSHQA